MKKEITNLNAKESLIRHSFEKEIDLSKLPLLEVKIPNRFKEDSFFPKNDFLLRISSKLNEQLEKFGANKEYIGRTVPGICEAIKNAYEHGNKKDVNKKIFFAKALSNKKIEFLVGDEGGKINGNFFPYVLLFRQKGYDKYYSTAPDFYKFLEELYSPLGHTGVGIRNMNVCFEEVNYFKRENGGLLVHLSKPFENK